jgi:peptidyl-prolyl cis-trans isomerase SurA
MKKKILIGIITFFSGIFVHAQTTGNVVDRVIGVVGDQMVKESDVEEAFRQLNTTGAVLNDSLRGVLFDQLMLKKLLIAQANHDSLTVTETEIDDETDRRMRYFLNNFKSDADFETFYGKSVDAFKFELHDQVKDLLLAQKMQSKVISGITVSPSDVSIYFNKQIADSLPLINAEVEIGQIVIVPPVNAEIKEYTRASLEDIRQRVISGKLKFCDAVAAYTEDPGSKANCGIYENVRRGTFVPEFDAVAFSTPEGQISEVFETPYGFHFLKVIQRKGEEVTVQHILKSIPASPDDLKASKYKLDSIKVLLAHDSMTWCEAAAKFSDDADTKYNCGLLVDPSTGNTKIDVDYLGDLDPDPQFPLLVNSMKVGDISAPQPCVTKDGKQGYRIIWLKSKTLPHRANLKDDYQLIQDNALQEKQNAALDAWVRKKLLTTYVRVAPDYQKYKYHYGWLTAGKT